MTADADTFTLIDRELAEGGGEAALAALADELKTAGRYHELFDVRLMQTRLAQGRPLIANESLDELPEPQRSEAEAAYLAACREVGAGLAGAGRFREAWMYIRPTGDRALLADALSQSEPDAEQMEEVIEIALYEGVAPRRGLELVLRHWGTCNAITTLEQSISRFTQPAQQETIATLVEHLHKELSENIRHHIRNRREKENVERPLPELLAAHEWIFENESYHIDTSHLASTVRLARLLENPADVKRAWELTEYGRRLAAKLRFDGEEPFVDIYPAHGLLFAATLGERVDEAIAYFRERADNVPVADEGTAPIETYLILLVRAGRHAEALEEMARLAPAKVNLSPYAPRLIDLARRAGRLDRYQEICRTRGDIVGYAAGVLEAAK